MSPRFWSRARGASVDGRLSTEADPGILGPRIPADERVRQAASAAPAQDLLAGLSPRVVRVLAGLHGAPRAIAEATIQLLPFGSRAGLEANDLAIRETDAHGLEFLRLMPVAYEAMAQAAALEDGTAKAAVDLERCLDRARKEYLSRRW